MPILISVIIIAALYLIYYLWNKRQNDVVLSSSERIKNLISLNNSTQFNKIQSNFKIYKYYDNKSNYTKIEPAFVMSAYLRENIEQFSEYILLLKDNRAKNIEYKKKVKEIQESEYPVDYKLLKIPKKVFCKLESKLFENAILRPVIDCEFYVLMSYSSPKGKVNLYKDAKFNFEDLLVSFESISRSRLDRETYKALSTVERGEVSDSLRYDILRRDNFACTICGASTKQGVRLHVDHIIPIAKGGKSTPDNLRTLCERCNIGKSDKIENNTPLSDSNDINRSNKKFAINAVHR